MNPVRVAIVGAGMMAHRRATALSKHGAAVICGVAARHISSAREFGAEFGCDACFDDFSRLGETTPDAILVEVPHILQDEVVDWALSHDLHVLVGGPLAYSSGNGESIRCKAQNSGLVVEAGFECRYKKSWEFTKSLIDAKRIGRVLAIRTLALWDCPSHSWYANQHESGGMPLTHMTYAFINPLRWLFGDPASVSAFANCVANDDPAFVREETCVANLLFPDAILCSMTAGYVKPSQSESWVVSVHGTEGQIDLYPSEMGAGRLHVFIGGSAETVEFSESPDAFEVQADTFLTALSGENQCRNGPEKAIGDIRIAEAIVASARGNSVVHI